MFVHEHVLRRCALIPLNAVSPTFAGLCSMFWPAASLDYIVDGETIAVPVSVALARCKSR